MKTFSIITLGCKVNQYESQQIRQMLEQFGLTLVESTENPDIVVVNTCCVTHTASAKSRQYVRKVQRLNPDAAIVVSGCLPTVQTCSARPAKLCRLERSGELARHTLGRLVEPIGELNGLDKKAYIIKNRQTTASALSQIVNELYKNHNFKYENNLATQPELPQLTCFKGHTRAFLKVQDGCDGFCTYCIVPQTRPVVQNKPLEMALKEAQALVEAGHKEIVVTGVFLGAYGQKTVRRKNWPNCENGKLADLLDKMAKIPNLARIRLSSLEPADVTPRLLDTFCEHPNIMPHLHLSLQSGSNAVLKKMCRQYSADDFREKVQLIKSRLDRPAITTDIIVGFPGETDADFEQTINLAKEVGFAKMHVFGFSSRKGTPAAAMHDKLPNKIIKERSKILRDLNAELANKFRQQFLGETATILMESSNGQPCGRSERYFMVYLENSDLSAVACPFSVLSAVGLPKAEALAKEEAKAEKNQKNAQHALRQNELLKVKLLENTKNGIIGRSWATSFLSS